MKRDLDFSDMFRQLNEDENQKKKFVVGGVVLVILILLIIFVCILIGGLKKKPSSVGAEGSVATESEYKLPEKAETATKLEKPSTVAELGEDSGDTYDTGMSDADVSEGTGASVSVDAESTSAIVGGAYGSGTTLGVDVSKFQGSINWPKVAASGIDFAMIRVGYRATKTGVMYEDSFALENMKNASVNGVQIGLYYFSSAVSVAEAVEEAEWVLDLINRSGVAVSYPIAYDCENYEQADSRQYGLTKSQRTEIACAFLQRIQSAGYTGMFYASSNHLKNEAKWETSTLENQFHIWVAQYPSSPYPETSASSYPGKYSVWQYTKNGSVPGINGNVDLDVAFYGGPHATGEIQYGDTSGDASGGTGASDGAAGGTSGGGTGSSGAGMDFADCNEQITAKIEVNLRDKPKGGSGSNVVHLLTNGEVVTRTGTNAEWGWSRVEWNGQTLYCVSSYVTTDLDYGKGQAPDPGSEKEEPEETGPVELKPIESNDPEVADEMGFYPCEDIVTPKGEVNIRVAPNKDAEIIANVKAGTPIQRTAYSKDTDADTYQWSRVVIDGQVGYCVTRFLKAYE